MPLIGRPSRTCGRFMEHKCRSSHLIAFRRPRPRPRPASCMVRAPTSSLLRILSDLSSRTDVGWELASCHVFGMRESLLSTLVLSSSCPRVVRRSRGGVERTSVEKCAHLESGSAQDYFDSSKIERKLGL